MEIFDPRQGVLSDADIRSFLAMLSAPDQSEWDYEATGEPSQATVSEADILAFRANFLPKRENIALWARSQGEIVGMVGINRYTESYRVHSGELGVGMGAAADLVAASDAEDNRAQLRHRRDYFIEQLENLAWPLVINGPRGISRHPGNANIQFVGFSAHDILGALQPHLAASTGSACTSGIPEPYMFSGQSGSTTIKQSLRFDLALVSLQVTKTSKRQ